MIGPKGRLVPEDEHVRLRVPAEPLVQPALVDAVDKPMPEPPILVERHDQRVLVLERVGHVLLARGTVVGQHQLRMEAVAEHAQPAKRVVVARVGFDPRLKVPHIADFVIAPADIDGNPGVVHRSHDGHPVPQLPLELLGGNSHAMDQIARIEQEVHPLPHNLGRQLRQNGFVDSGQRVPAVAGHDETPAFSPSRRRRDEKTEQQHAQTSRSIHGLRWRRYTPLPAKLWPSSETISW